MLPLMMHQKFLIRSRDRVDEMVVDQLSRVDGGRQDQSGAWSELLVGVRQQFSAAAFTPRPHHAALMNFPCPRSRQASIATGRCLRA